MLLALAIFVSVLMPLYAAHLAWSSRRGGRLAFLLKAAGTIGFMGFLTLIARWDILSVHLVWLWWALVALLLAAGLWAMRGRRWIEGEKRGTLLATALEPVVGLGLFGYAALGLLHEGEAVALGWPLGEGRFVVAHGGGSAMLNYHNVHPPQRYALDILALDEWGRRAEGIEPAVLAAYAIYGTPVVAPCDGEVIAAVDGIAESAIGATNTAQPAGNQVVLRCGAIDVELAHLRPGTVAVAVGETVATGQVLGEVGNSGNTSEPHLHIHAVPAGTGEAGAGVPLTFGGRFLVRGAIVDG